MPRLAALALLLVAACGRGAGCSIGVPGVAMTQWLLAFPGALPEGP